MHTSIVRRDRASMRYYRRKTPQGKALTARPVPGTSLRDGRLCDPVAVAAGPTIEAWLRHG
jgi:hypothetical protein